MQKPLILISALCLINLLGCASTKQTVLPQDGPSMKMIYQVHMDHLNSRDPVSIRKSLGHRHIHSGDTALQSYTRDVANEIEVLFPRLPNPTLVMYVFPHLAGEESVPVPGYATAFPMYRNTEYALPGERSVQPVNGAE